ncbi:MAG: SAM-dependent DNA methyltransferase [Chloroflexi bacterium]|nr:SAM-dependent DNA methyltransferase [Chloroflexota bacterium]
MAIQISDEVKNVLLRSTITGDRVVLPPEQLDRKLYTDVNKVLDAYGGKWNRSERAHFFKSDPRVKLAEALETGRATHEKQTYQAFYTPEPLAERMADEADIVPSELVLEPSAGTGRLVVPCLSRGARVFACELRTELHPDLLRLGVEKMIGFDFMKVAPWAGYDTVVMNPPFTNAQDALHILHAWNFLKPKGRLVSIASAGVLFRDDKPYKALRELIAQYGQCDELPEGTFAEEGTNVGTVTIKLTRPQMQFDAERVVPVMTQNGAAQLALFR